MDEIKLLPVWVTWRMEQKGDKLTKVPYQNSPYKASSTDPKTWSTYDLAMINQALYPPEHPSHKDGIGLVFERIHAGVIGVDFDHCVDPDTNEIFPQYHDFLTKANTYCEFSPSKTGFHVLFQSKDLLPIEVDVHKYYFQDAYSLEHSSHVEMYTSGRYFTFTENQTSFSKPIRTIDQEEFISLLTILGYPWGKASQTNTEFDTLNKEYIQQLDPTPTPQFQDKPLSDPDILKKMFASKNGAKIKSLYDGDLSETNNDHSSADFTLALHLAFWTRKDPVQMERVWLASPLGQRQKTQERQDYRTATIEKAIDTTEEVYQPRAIVSDEHADIDYDFLMTVTKDGEKKISLIFPNIIRVLSLNPYFKNKFRKNEFSHLVESCLSSDDEWTPLNDDVISKARQYIAEHFSPFRSVSKDMVTDAIMRVACDTRVNPPRDYFTSLVWDKTPRLDSWLHQAYGTPDDELNQSIGSNWIKGLVKRVMMPGCQFDEVLALESPQGWRKSTSIRVLGQPWHVETAHSIENKDFYLLLAQNIIVEFSEGEIFDRASVKKLKAEITKTEDQVRPPYERGIVKFKRSCVFAVTTNKLELKDDTGNRRWLPVSLEKPADIDWLRENRDQLFAEAYYRVIVKNETTHEYPKESLDDLQSSRAEWGDYDEKTLLWYASLLPYVRDEEGISVHQAFRAVYEKDNEYTVSKLEEMQMGGILKRSLALENRNKKIRGAVSKRWFPSTKTNRLVNDIINHKDDSYDM